MTDNGLENLQYMNFFNKIGSKSIFGGKLIDELTNMTAKVSWSRAIKRRKTISLYLQAKNFATRVFR